MKSIGYFTKAWKDKSSRESRYLRELVVGANRRRSSSELRSGAVRGNIGERGFFN